MEAESSEKSLPPDVESLRSPDELTSSGAWIDAYPLLWEAGLQVARSRMAGENLAIDREDIVSTALHQFVRGLVENRAKSFKQISGWDDCLRMMRAITRSRITDFFRTHYRNREDAVGDLPEPHAAEVIPFGPGVEDIFAEIDRLDPPMPELFRERFVKGRTIDEIAEKQGLNRNTLCSWFAKSLATLRSRLNRDELRSS